MMFEDWTVPDLRALKKKLEEMYAQGIRQSTFKDQMLMFVSSSELKERITDVSTAIEAKEDLPGSSRNKKQIRITTRHKGFR